MIHQRNQITLAVLSCLFQYISGNTVTWKNCQEKLMQDSLNGCSGFKFNLTLINTSWALTGRLWTSSFLFCYKGILMCVYIFLYILMFLTSYETILAAGCLWSNCWIPTEGKGPALKHDFDMQTNLQRPYLFYLWCIFNPPQEAIFLNFNYPRARCQGLGILWRVRANISTCQS